MCHIKKSLKTENLSGKAQDIILQSWRKSTQKQYSGHLNKWYKYSAQRNEDPFNSPVAVWLDFLATLYEEGLSYSSINTAKSAISTIHAS